MASTNDIISGIARTQEERILLTQIAQKAETCREKCYLTHTKFLDMHEAALADRLQRGLGERGIFWGGYEQAERRMVFFLPEWMDAVPTEGEDCPIVVIRCLRSKNDALTHRDYLGSLMGLGPVSYTHLTLPTICSV